LQLPSSLPRLDLAQGTCSWDLTIQLRGASRAKVGVRSEKLVEFKVPPLRPRPRKLKPTEPVEIKSAG
jgi:hypothetical protein